MAYIFAVVDAHGFGSNNRLRIWSRHNTLASAQKQYKKNIVKIPGNGEQQSAMIISSDDCQPRFTIDEVFVFEDAVRGPVYRTHDWAEVVEPS